MKLAAVALLVAVTAQAQDLARPVPTPEAWPAHIPRTVIAVTQDHSLVLLTDSCGWPSGARRAYQTRQGRLTWACWGYTELGIQLVWQDGSQTHESLHALRTTTGHAVTYPWLYERTRR